MSGKWDADLTNDSDRDYDLYVELLEDDEYRGRIERNDNGDVVVRFYGAATVPWDWLAGLVERFKAET